MNRLAAFLLCVALLTGVARAQTVTPLVDQTTPFRDSSVAGDIVYTTGDELATQLVFTGTRRITQVTFKYVSRVPINYTMRFYKLPPPILPQTAGIGAILKTLTFPNLPAGSNIFTVNLSPTQQFDWAATLDYTGIFPGGFYSVQMTKTDGSNTGLDAGFPLATPGRGSWSNLTQRRGEDVVSAGLLPFRPEFEEVGLPSVGFFVAISGFEIAAPAPVTLSTLTLSTNTVTGGTNLTGTVALSAVAVEDTTVSLFNNSGGQYVQTPITVTVPTGAQSVTFPIVTGAVDSSRYVSIQAHYAGKVAQQFLVVNSNAAPALSDLLLLETSVKGGTSLLGIVVLNGSVATNRVVTLSTSNGAVAQTPVTVTVPAGTQSASFTITTNSVNTNQTVQIQATFAGKTVKMPLTVTKKR